MQVSLLVLCFAIHRLIALVSGKSRQLKHRLVGRRNAISSRRSTKPENSPVPDAGRYGKHSASQLSLNGAAETNGQKSVDLNRGSSSPSVGFTAVNNRDLDTHPQVRELNSNYQFSNTGLPPSQVTSGNQRSGSITKTKEEMRAELMKKFVTTTEASQSRRSSATITTHPKKLSVDHPRPQVAQARRQSNRDSSLEISDTQTSPVFGTPSVRPAAMSQSDEGGPFRQEMARRVEQLARYEAIFPPCDRCRRLSVTCTKNLTACQGCTRKHAKCCWKDVQEGELSMLIGERAMTKDEVNHDLKHTQDTQDEQQIRRRGRHEDESSEKEVIFDRGGRAKPETENEIRGSRASTHASPGSIRDPASPLQP